MSNHEQTALAQHTGDSIGGDKVGGDKIDGTMIKIDSVFVWQGLEQNILDWIVSQSKKEGKKLKPEELKQIGWEKIDWTWASQIYRQKLAHLYGSMHIFGMAQSVPLGNVFTDVYLLDKPSAWRRHAIEQLRAYSQRQAESVDTTQRREGTALVEQHSRLFILGQPGSGKTTFLKHLVIQAIEGKLDVIPIFVELKAWSDTNNDLLSFLVRQFAICHFPNARPFVETILEDGRAIVLFDGLDEVNYTGGKRESITAAIREFAQQYSKSRIVITCRTAATEYVFERFNYCELADFTQDQIATFAGRWFQQDAVKRTAFLDAFAQPDNERLRELARRPLLLTMLCITFDETMAFPQRRAELYEEAIDALLKKWDSSRSIRRDTIYRKLSLGYKRQLLMDLAADTFGRGEFFMAKRDLTERVTRFLKRLPPMDLTEDMDGEVVLHSIEAQHGLLIERAHDIYSFSHLTFHEYFAARYAADHPEESVLRSAIAHATDTQWREVLLLIASMLDYHNVAILFRIWYTYLQQQIREDRALTAFIAAVIQRAQNLQPSGPSTRAFVMTIALIAQGRRQLKTLMSYVDRAQDISRTFGHTLGHDLTRTLGRDLARAQELAQDLISAKDINHALTSAKALHRALDNDLDRAQELVGDRDYNRDRAQDIVHDIDRALDCSSALDHALTSARDLGQIYSFCQRYEPPSISLSPKQVELPHDWQFTETQRDTLQAYTTSILRLLECLDLAVIEDRKAVLDQLLIIPD